MLHDVMRTFFGLLKLWLKGRFNHLGAETLFKAV